MTGLKQILTDKLDDEAQDLVTIFLLAMKKNCILDILDSHITGERGIEKMLAFANLAYRCLNFDRRKRPTVKQVVAGEYEEYK